MTINILRYSLLFLAMLVCEYAFSQIRKEYEYKHTNTIDTIDTNSSELIDRLAYRKKKKEKEANEIKPLVKLWKLEADGAYKVRNYIDTMEYNAQIMYPIYRNSIVNSFTGNAVSPYQSSIFIKREPIQEFLFLQPYDIYISHPSKTNFINTRTPYTDLRLTVGGKGIHKEHIMNVLFSRNINKYWNLSFKYNLIVSDGQYQNQKQKQYDFTLLSSYEQNRYGIHAFASLNKIKGKENGGIVDDDVVDRDTTVKAPSMETRLINVEALFDDVNYYVSQNYNIGVAKEREIFGDTISVYPIKVVHTTYLQQTKRNYSDEETSSNFYNKFFYSYNKTNDETKFQSFKNSAQIVLNEGYFDFLKFGLRAQLHYENNHYKMLFLKPEYPTGKSAAFTKYKQNNAAFEVGSFFNIGKKNNWAVSYKKYFSGYRNGDTESKSYYTRFFGSDSTRNHKFNLEFKFYNKTPSLLWQNYFSNHIYWDNDFVKERSIKIGGSYDMKHWELELGGYWQSIDNYLYFDKNAMPAQANSKIKVLTLYGKKDFRFWKIHIEPTVFFQQSSDNNILSLPKFALYCNNYFEGDLFNKALHLRVGGDVRFHTEYNAPAYFPATGQYHLQDTKKIGNFFKIDLYFIAKFRHAAFFMKYEHFNNLFGNTGYFSALHYPITPNVLKYGVRWYFYN